MIELKSYITSAGEKLLYTGDPNLKLLDELSNGPGDLWHSSKIQGFKNCFPELVYQSAVYWWYISDFDTDKISVNWRVNSNAFVVRESVWNHVKGVDTNYKHNETQGIDLGFSLITTYSGVPLFVKELYKSEENVFSISNEDRYYFFAKHFKKWNRYYMLFRKGLFKFPSEYKAFLKSKHVKQFSGKPLPTRELSPIKGNPSVSLIIPTMKRQEYTELLLQDYNAQTYKIKEAVIVDATPKKDRDDKFYKQENFNFEIKLKWQTSKGSCRARNEAIELASGDYIIFADDDVRVLPDFVEKHIKLLQTYNAGACNGLDIMATNTKQDLTDLKNRLLDLGNNRWKVGVSSIFSNANSCVRSDIVNKIIGNDINFDGGYGEDTDFGLRILKSGEVLLHNPFSPNLHLKPPQGGYRFWGNQSKVIGKKRKLQPWELDKPVKWIKPKPTPTITYGVLKHYKPEQIKEWKKKHFFLYLFLKGNKNILLRLFSLPYKLLQFKVSLRYAKRLIDLGPRYK